MSRPSTLRFHVATCTREELVAFAAPRNPQRAAAAPLTTADKQAIAARQKRFAERRALIDKVAKKKIHHHHHGCRSSTGTRSSPTPPSPMPSPTASPTTPTALPQGRQHAKNQPILTQPRKPDPTPMPVTTPGRLRWNRSAAFDRNACAFNRNPRPQMDQCSEPVQPRTIFARSILRTSLRDCRISSPSCRI
jgi:hypothetical protein